MVMSILFSAPCLFYFVAKLLFCMMDLACKQLYNYYTALYMLGPPDSPTSVTYNELVVIVSSVELQ